MAQLEKWKDIAGYEGVYQISDLGRLKALPIRIWFGNRWYQKKMKFIGSRTSNKFPYLYATLVRNGEHKKYLVHRLVLEAFIGECPEGMEARHLNGDAQDNRLENLCWGTGKQNAEDRRRHGTANVGERNGQARFSEELVGHLRSGRASGLSQAQLSRRYGVSQSHISKILSGKRRTYISRSTLV